MLPFRSQFECQRQFHYLNFDVTQLCFYHCFQFLHYFWCKDFNYFIFWSLMFCELKSTYITGSLLNNMEHQPCLCSKVPLQKLTVVQSVKKFTAFHETHRLITVITKADTGAHSEPHKSSHFPHTTLNIHFKISLPSITMSSK